MDFELALQGIIPSVFASIVDTCSHLVLQAVSLCLVFCFPCGIVVYPWLCEHIYGVGGTCAACVPCAGPCNWYAYPFVLAIPETVRILVALSLVPIGIIVSAIRDSTSFPLSLPGALFSCNVAAGASLWYLFKGIKVLSHAFCVRCVGLTAFCPITFPAWVCTPACWFCPFIEIQGLRLIPRTLIRVLSGLFIGAPLIALDLIMAMNSNIYHICVDPICAAINGAVFPVDYEKFVGSFNSAVESFCAIFSTGASSLDVDLGLDITAVKTW